MKDSRNGGMQTLRSGLVFQIWRRYLGKLSPVWSKPLRASLRFYPMALFGLVVISVSILPEGYGLALVIPEILAYLVSLVLGETFPRGFRLFLYGTVGSVFVLLAQLSEEAEALAPMGFGVLGLVSLFKAFGGSRTANVPPCCQ